MKVKKMYPTGPSTLQMLQVAFIVMKIMGLLTLSWPLVFIPFYCSVLFGLIATAMKKHKKRKKKSKEPKTIERFVIFKNSSTELLEEKFERFIDDSNVQVLNIQTNSVYSDASGQTVHYMFINYIQIYE